MFTKSCKPPVSLPALEALERRLPNRHPRLEEVREELRIARAGFRGEESLLYFLRMLPGYQIYHHLRLPSGSEDSFFQIDFLLASPSHLVILEVKNYAGTLYFDRTFSQLIQEKDGSTKAFIDPITQAKQLQASLTNWIGCLKLPIPPIDYLIIIPGTQTIIKSSAEYPAASQQVLHKEGLLLRLASLKASRKKDILQPKQLRRLSKQLLIQHTPLIPQLLKKYQIAEGDLIPGVLCANCRLQMKCSRQRWTCSACGSQSGSAYIQALEDFALLNGPSITAAQCQHFLQLPSRYSAYRLLTKMNLATTVSSKKHYYHLPIETLN